MSESANQNKGPVGENGRSGPAPPASGRGRNVAGEKLIRSRRSNLLRMLILPLVVTAGVILLVFVLREVMDRQVHVHAMNTLAQQVSEFRQRENRLPSEKEFSKLERPRRVSEGNVEYGGAYVLEDSPSDTVLAHTRARGFRFIEDGHAVLDLEGNVAWVSRQRLRDMLKEREQRFNARNIEH